MELYSGLDSSLNNLVAFIGALPDDKLSFSYGEGKWALAEVLVHLFDTERIFQYRALRFARNDKKDLPGFDQNSYVPESSSSSRTKEDLINEFTSIRKASISLFQSFNKDVLLRMGTASGSNMSVRALGFMIIGHQAHHVRILKERYL